MYHASLAEGWISAPGGGVLRHPGSSPTSHLHLPAPANNDNDYQHYYYYYYYHHYHCYYYFVIIVIVIIGRKFVGALSRELALPQSFASEDPGTRNPQGEPLSVV